MYRRLQAIAVAVLVVVPATGTETGIVVESVAPGRVAERAGIKTGDLLLRWKAHPNTAQRTGFAAGELTEPHQLFTAQTEHACRGPVTIFGLRGDTELTIEMMPGQWGLEARPDASIDVLDQFLNVLDPAGSEEQRNPRKVVGELFESENPDVAVWIAAKTARMLVDNEHSDQASEVCSQAAEAAQGRTTCDAIAWLRLECGQTFFRRYEYDHARAHVEPAFSLLQDCSGDSLRTAEAAHRLGSIARRLLDDDSARSRFRQALELRQRLAPDSMCVAESLSSLGGVEARLGNLDEAEALQERALALRQSLSPGSLEEADSYSFLALIAYRRGDLARAYDLWSKTRAIQETLAPESRGLALTLNNLGAVAQGEGRLEQAQPLLERSLAIYLEIAPESRTVVRALTNLGVVAHERGDLAGAECFYRRAVERAQKRQQDPENTAVLLENLGVVATERGHLGTAEESIRASLEIQRKIAPASGGVARVLNNLGNVAIHRGDLDAAEVHLKEALDISQEIEPDSLSLAWRYFNLGRIALDRGDLLSAEDLFGQALELRSRLAPETLDVATTQHYLAMVALDRNDLDQASDLLDAATKIRRRLAPDSLVVSHVIRDLGELDFRSGDAKGALEHFDHALAIRQRLAPGSFFVAESHHDRARVLADEGRLDDALTAIDLAAAALGSQQGRLGGTSSSRMAFRAKSAEIGRDRIELLVSVGRPVDALHAAERTRARELLTMLAERELVFAADLPPELERERRLTAAEIDRVQTELAGLSSTADPDRVDELSLRLVEVRRHQEELREKVRRLAPEVARLEAPEVLDLDGVRRALDPGTVLLEYAFTETGLLLFVVAAAPGPDDLEPFAVLELAVDREQVASEVHALRVAIAAGRDRSAGAEAVRRRGERLYRWLVAPAQPWIDRAQRVLVAADGPLHELPFPALVEPAEGDDAARFLIESRPIHVVQSATVFSHLRDRRRTREADRPPVVAAFGDPVYRDNPVIALGLAPLPASRWEAAGVAEVWGDGASLYLGPDATETNLKSAAAAADIVHFAGHGVLDPRMPFASGLALSTPESPDPASDNGVLQGWEIIEELRLDADLVVLSACESGLGEVVGGEGLLGLTWAFHFAGAQSVVATQWAVPDESTALLMRRFHTRLRTGTTADEALRAAQLELLAGPIEFSSGDTARQIDATHPYAWAGFALYGDWR